MTLISRVRIGIQPCGCIHESSALWRALQHWRCPTHEDRYVHAAFLVTLRRCESCRQRRARYRMTFSDGASWLVCFECELPRSR